MKRSPRIPASAWLALASSAASLTACWPTDTYPYDWCSPSAAPTPTEVPEVTDDGVVRVREEAIVIAAGTDGTRVRLVVEATRIVTDVEVAVSVPYLTGGAVLGEASRRVNLAEGDNLVELLLPPLSQEVMTQARLSYSVTRPARSGEEGGAMVHGMVSLIEHADTLRVHVAVPATVLAGERVALRVIGVRSRASVAGFDASAWLVVGGETVASGRARASQTGVAIVSLGVPEGASGAAELRLEAVAPDGPSYATSFPITVTRGGALMLSTDKPRYQPGQTMHLRLMALHRPDMRPIAGEPIRVVVADGKGYKVFQETLETNAFGIAAGEFGLASEVNTGTYELSATMGDEEAREHVIVERYVLPKLEIAVDLDRPYLLPRQSIGGTVGVRYPFGEAVPGALVELDLRYGDDTLIASLTGMAGADGRYRFDMPVPELAATNVRLVVEATDAAGQSHSKELALATAQQGVSLWMVPAADRTAGEPWTVYVIARDPAGRPVRGSGTATYDGTRWPLETDGAGIAAVALPAGVVATVLEVSLASGDGLTGSAFFPVAEQDFPTGLALHIAEPRYSVGESATVGVSGPPGLTGVELATLRDGNVLGTQIAALDANGKASVSLPVSEDMDGVMVVEAFAVGADGIPLRGRAAFYARSPGKLHIDTTLDEEVHRPGETARVDFHVTDPSGAGVAAALGVVIVDEAVYALEALGSTTFEQFFSSATLPAEVDKVMERESAESLLEAEAAEQELAARAVLAASANEQAMPDPLVDQIRDLERSWAGSAVSLALDVIVTQASSVGWCGGASPEPMAQRISEVATATADPWGQAYGLTTVDADWTTEVTLSSGGPDERRGTADDISVTRIVNR